MNLHFIRTLSVEQMIWWELTKASGFKCLAPALAPKLVCVAAGSMWTVSRQAMFPWYFIILITSHIAGSDLSQSSSSGSHAQSPPSPLCHHSMSLVVLGRHKRTRATLRKGKPQGEDGFGKHKAWGTTVLQEWSHLVEVPDFLEVDIWKHPDPRAEMLTLISFPMPASKNKQTTTKSLLSCLFIYFS